MQIKSKVMTLNTVGRVAYLTYDRLSRIPGIRHAFSTRLGGISEGYCAEMNLAFGRGDPQETVLENYRIFCNAAGFDVDSLVASAQDHHTFVRRVSAENRGTGIFRPRDIQSVDGLITNDPQVTLVTYYADCTPLFFVDPVKRAIGLAHGGWRGTAAKIGANVVNKMVSEFRTDPADLICAIGPAISVCCYEVDEPVHSAFTAAFGDTSDILFDKGGGKYMLDLLQANRRVLTDCGVLSQNIVTSDLCTNCHSDILWSHRATGGRRGTMAAFLSLNSQL